VKSVTADYFAKARRLLDGARTIADAGVTEVAAREAYLAALQAAEGLYLRAYGQSG
jgi:hypothetical protein